jgi:hypothetical protein
MAELIERQRRSFRARCICAVVLDFMKSSTNARRAARAHAPIVPQLPLWWWRRRRRRTDGSRRPRREKSRRRDAGAAPGDRAEKSCGRGHRGRGRRRGRCKPGKDLPGRRVIGPLCQRSATSYTSQGRSPVIVSRSHCTVRGSWLAWATKVKRRRSRAISMGPSKSESSSQCTSGDRPPPPPAAAVWIVDRARCACGAAATSTARKRRGSATMAATQKSRGAGNADDPRFSLSTSTSLVSSVRNLRSKAPGPLTFHIRCSAHWCILLPPLVRQTGIVAGIECIV